MNSRHHDLDIHPIPEDKNPLFVNEPWLIDQSQAVMDYVNKAPEPAEDNIRIYIPFDINKSAIIRRLFDLIDRYVEANEDNEFNFSSDVDALVSQIEIYDQVWSVKHMQEEGSRSKEAIELVEEFIERLEEIPDGGAELFPFELIEKLREQYFVIK
jgi:hypothetical protein